MSAKRLGLVAFVLTALAVGTTALALDASEGPASDSATAEALAEELDAAAGNWTHAGCIQLGSTCYDVFRDPRGDLWVCAACFTTQNPNRGNCRKLTPWEILNSLWCV